MKLKTAVQLKAHCETHGGLDPMWLPVEIEWDWDGEDGSGLVITQTGNPYCDRCNPDENCLSTSNEVQFFREIMERGV